MGDVTLEKANLSLRIELGAYKLLYKPVVRRSVRQIVQGRLLDPDDPKRGRWLRTDVDALLRATWARVDELVPEAGLATLPTFGSRSMVFLAVVTTAAYQALIEQGLSPVPAANLIADVGWKLYALGISLVSFPFRMSTRDTGKRMDRTIKALMVFPFSAPGRPGYEVKVWREGGQLLTHWTSCPPQTFVRDLVERQGDRGELDAFYRSWCHYDWPGADVIADDGEHGHYSRKHTMSRGDAVCDMCWKDKACNKPVDIQ